MKRRRNTQTKKTTKNMDMEQNLQTVEELTLSPSRLCSPKPKHKTRLQSRPVLLWQIRVAKSACPFTEGEFVKNCMLNFCDVVDRKKVNCFLMYSKPDQIHRHWTFAAAVHIMKDDPLAKIKNFIMFPRSADWSTDASDIAPKLILICGFDSSLCLSVSEEFCNCVQCMARL